MNRLRVYLTAALLLAVSGLGLVAQQNRQGQGRNRRGAADRLTLVYDREVFDYRGSSRRDPFAPLTQDNEMGPRFQELTLQGIMYSSVPGESIAVIRAGGERIFRARVGDVVGNSRVIEIGPTRVVMAVENFGTIRQEILELPQRGGAER